MKYEKHVFVCCNQKADGKKCCGEDTGEQYAQYLRTKLIEVGINPKQEIRVQESGCLGVCKNGQAIAVYPEGIFYGNVTEGHLDSIVNEHLLKDAIIEKLTV